MKVLVATISCPVDATKSSLVSKIQIELQVMLSGTIRQLLEEETLLVKSTQEAIQHTISLSKVNSRTSGSKPMLRTRTSAVSSTQTNLTTAMTLWAVTERPLWTDKSWPHRKKDPILLANAKNTKSVFYSKKKLNRCPEVNTMHCLNYPPNLVSFRAKTTLN